MNNLKTTDTGGFPLKLDDFRFVNNAVLEAFKGMMSMYDVIDSHAVILSGCARTSASGTTSIAQGYISIGGEICFVPAHSYPTPSVVQNEYWMIDVSYYTSGNKTFQSTTPHDTYEVRVGKIQVSNTVPAGFTTYANTKNVFTLLKETVGTPTGGIIMWSGTINAIPIGWVLCDGTNGTPNLRDRFVVGAGDTYNVGDTGGQSNFTINNNNLPQHKHAPGTLKSKANNDEFITIPYDIAYHPSATGGMVNNGIPSSSSNGPDWSGQINGNLKWNLLIDGNTDFGGGVASPDSIDNKPPYYALAYIMKV